MDHPCIFGQTSGSTLFLRVSCHTYSILLKKSIFQWPRLYLLITLLICFTCLAMKKPILNCFSFSRRLRIFRILMQMISGLYLPIPAPSGSKQHMICSLEHILFHLLLNGFGRLVVSSSIRCFSVSSFKIGWTQGSCCSARIYSCRNTPVLCVMVLCWRPKITCSFSAPSHCFAGDISPYLVATVSASCTNFWDHSQPEASLGFAVFYGDHHFGMLGFLEYHKWLHLQTDLSKYLSLSQMIPWGDEIADLQGQKEIILWHQELGSNLYLGFCVFSGAFLKLL